MTTEAIQAIINLINSNLDYVKKFKTEKFKDKWLIDVFLNSNILNIVLDDNISVNVSSQLNHHIIDFFSNERKFQSFEEFKAYFNQVVRGYSEQTDGIYVKYKGEEYLCEIEVTSVDPDRQMGPETLYELSFTNNSGEHIVAADISEYPMGAFSIYELNEDVEVDEQQVINYFMDKTME
ncbi:hypothetical protein JMN32_06820 [Fulvivirga sp. 29W222]|uniref:Uncharacterized protein n=1 Tax=Fulvivirga marina TaxID=2494733 RepID=A0A937KBH7_9BACT|nr:hypothetical protein [Fulvivirga marina]MBL6446014.1 hypothetical protein [Fulvivirga marina]